MIINNLIAGSRPTMIEMNKMFFPMPYIYWCSFLRYAQEALYLTEITKYKIIYDVTSSLELFGYKFENWWWTVLSTALFGLFYRVLAYIALLLLPPDVWVRRWLSFVFDIHGHWSRIKRLFKRQKSQEQA